jgi:Sigma-70 region 2
VRLTITTDPEDVRGYSSPDPGEGELLGRLRAGDEEASARLVDRHHAAMVRFARGYVRSPAVAEEVAQDAWLGLLRGLDRFEGRIAAHLAVPHRGEPGDQRRAARAAAPAGRRQ